MGSNKNDKKTLFSHREHREHRENLLKKNSVSSVASVAKKAKNDEEEPPPILKSWKNFYLLVLGNLIFWIILFTIFTWMFQ